MLDLNLDSETNKPYVYSGGTVVISGSAVIPEYNASVYGTVAKINQIYKDNPKELQDFNDKTIDFLVEQLKQDVKRDQRAYKTQEIYGIIIFVIANLLVFSGIAFSFFQFYNAIKFGDYSQLSSSLEIGITGNLVFNSSLVGAFVLVLSLLFFFLFLKYVYKTNIVKRHYIDDFKEVISMKQAGR